MENIIKEMKERYEGIVNKYKNKKANDYPYLTIYLNLKKDPENYKKTGIFVENVFKDIKNGNFTLDKEYTNKEKFIIRRLEEYKNEVLAWLEANYKYSKNGAVLILGGDEDAFEIIEVNEFLPAAYFLKELPELSYLIASLEEKKPTLAFLSDARDTKVYLSAFGEVREITDLENEF